MDDEEDASDETLSTNFLKEIAIQKYDRADLDVYTMKDLVAATLERENELKQTHCNLTAIAEHRRAVRSSSSLLLLMLCIDLFAFEESKFKYATERSVGIGNTSRSYSSKT